MPRKMDQARIVDTITERTDSLFGSLCDSQWLGTSIHDFLPSVTFYIRYSSSIFVSPATLMDYLCNAGSGRCCASNSDETRKFL